MLPGQANNSFPFRARAMKSAARAIFVPLSGSTPRHTESHPGRSGLGRDRYFAGWADAGSPTPPICLLSAQKPGADEYVAIPRCASLRSTQPTTPCGCGRGESYRGQAPFYGFAPGLWARPWPRSAQRHRAAYGYREQAPPAHQHLSIHILPRNRKP